MLKSILFRFNIKYIYTDISINEINNFFLENLKKEFESKISFIIKQNYVIK